TIAASPACATWPSSRSASLSSPRKKKLFPVKAASLSAGPVSLRQSANQARALKSRWSILSAVRRYGASKPQAIRPCARSSNHQASEPWPLSVLNRTWFERDRFFRVVPQADKRCRPPRKIEQLASALCLQISGALDLPTVNAASIGIALALGEDALEVAFLN